MVTYKERGYFVFDGIDSRAYGVYLSAGMAFDGAEDDYEKIEIPGRSGDLIMSSNRLRNRPGSYPAFIFAYDERSFSRKVENFRNAIGSRRGYFKLQDSYNPDTYMMAAYTGGMSVSPQSMNRVGSFDITFDCKPQRFLSSGDVETVYTGNGSIFNPTGFASKPLLIVTGYGQIGLGDYIITITGDANTVTYIDCDVMDAYGITGGIKVGRNGSVTTGKNYPTIEPGINGISLGANISKLSITPRWWEK